MALHALAYCPRLFYLEEVKEIRVADERVYAGRDHHPPSSMMPKGVER
jgi:CRISPR-associated protein Cas1